MIKCELLVTCVLCFTFVMATEVREAKARPEGWVVEAEWWSAGSCSAAWGSSSHQGRRIFFRFSDKSHKLGVLLNLWRNTLTRDLVQWFTHWCWPWQGWNYSEWGHWEHLSPPPTMAQRWAVWEEGGGTKPRSGDSHGYSRQQKWDKVSQGSGHFYNIQNRCLE